MTAVTAVTMAGMLGSAMSVTPLMHRPILRRFVVNARVAFLCGGMNVMTAGRVMFHRMTLMVGMGFPTKVVRVSEIAGTVLRVVVPVRIIHAANVYPMGVYAQPTMLCC
ncbi:hypothetical protein [Ruicaihuangia caeni]|uniref:hypothetical protein n=1 Tax=Ruicaihuangia caeni TaxID=3042517 RepID=UPI00338D50B2